MLDQELLDILCCPACKGDIRYDEAAARIICLKCGLKYPVRDDIPIMLVEEAEK